MYNKLTEQRIQKLCEERNIEIVEYTIYKAPKTPTENGEYYGKTPIWEQALVIYNKAKENGKRMLIKAVCSDGKERDIM